MREPQYFNHIPFFMHAIKDANWAVEKLPHIRFAHELHSKIRERSKNANMIEERLPELFRLIFVMHTPSASRPFRKAIACGLSTAKPPETAWWTGIRFR